MIYCKFEDGRETPTSSSPVVRSMQDGLAKLGIPMISDKEYPPDGRYGKATVNGVAAFKVKHGLPGDGLTFDSTCLTVMLTQLAALQIGVPQAEVDTIRNELATSYRDRDLLAERVTELRQAEDAAKIAADQQRTRIGELEGANLARTAELVNVSTSLKVLDTIKIKY